MQRIVARISIFFGAAVSSTQNGERKQYFPTRAGRWNHKYTLRPTFLGNLTSCFVLTKDVISLHYPSVVLDGEVAAPRTRERDPKSAIAGYNSLQSNGRIARRGSAALKAGSGAARTCEPRQDRKVATVSGNPWVPSGHLAGASDSRTAGRPPRSKVHDLFFCVRANSILV